MSLATVTQVAEAEIVASRVDFGGLKQAASNHPIRGARREMDEMLDIFQKLIRPLGEKPSAFVGAEFLDALASLQRPPCLLATGDKSGLCAEFPFPGQSTLLQVSTSEVNPRAGRGLLIRTTLPIEGQKAEFFRVAMELNETELKSMTRCHFTGSWCAGEHGLTFVSFAPNILSAPSALTNLIWNEVVRAKWVTEEIFSFSQEANFEEALQRKMDQLQPIPRRKGSS